MTATNVIPFEIPRKTATSGHPIRAESSAPCERRSHPDTRRERRSPPAIVRWSRRRRFPVNLSAIGMAVAEHGLRAVHLAGWALVAAIVVFTFIAGLADAIYGR